ncbi:MFS transporter [Actinocatenispora rupis]|uniref:Putative proline/betaine transporter n=1 Tax=Actinocatenispora rupis TaxID=519421 RepID=A0A8J3N932_9ACTN|nr:MFS transporter [Actinocatenispora rupis]GID10716.1 MFS transporter [Actinocatenispora rupis]
MTTETPETRSATRAGGGSLARVLAASMVGTTVEWYDFFLYGSAAALVFNKVFFPTTDPLVGTMLAFVTYALGFVARPLGGIVFGHFGDRIGRKKLLMLSLLMMGGGTLLIGVLPTYGTVHIWAPVMLTVLRLVQGFAIGGEWGGAVLLVAEHGSPQRRGFWASWPQAGAPAGNLIATAVLAILAGVLPDAQFLAWGWRIPFLLSAVLIAIGYWVRSSVEDAPLFLAAKKRETHTRMPVVRVLTRYPKQLLVCVAARFAENVVYYVITAFVLVYATEHLGLAKSLILGALLVANAVHLVVIPLFGALSDKIGRRPVYLIGTVLTGLWAFAFFGLLDTKSTLAIGAAVVVGLIGHAAMYGPQAAFFAEQFDTGVRYTGTSVGYQVTSIIAGSLAPIIAVALLDHFGTGYAIAVYVLFTAVVSTIGVLLSVETRHVDLAAEAA